MVSKSQKGFLIRQNLEAELAAKKKSVKKEKKEGRGDTEDFTTKKGDKLKTGKRKGQKAFAKEKS